MSGRVTVAERVGGADSGQDRSRGTTSDPRRTGPRARTVPALREPDFRLLRQA
jgi:hypothetical protein